MGGIRILRLFGIDILLHQTLAVIVALIVASLGLGLLPAWHPDWGPATVWLTAGAATVALLASILLHELSHALVAKARGLPVTRITLFLFGGVANIEREPPSPGTELLIAIVGPITSLAIGFACAFGGAALLDGGDPMAALRSAGPLATILLWLGPVNVLLGLFNMVPGFPLDGGRVLRALIWWATGSLRTATRWASRAGQMVAFLLVASGLSMMFGARLPVFGTGVVSGLWLIFIGWFLNTAAMAAWTELVLHEALRDVPVARVMRRHVPGVPVGTSVSRVVNDWVMGTEHRSFPVMDGERMVGQVGIADIRKVPRSVWDETPVESVMTPASELPVLDAGADAEEAMRSMGTREQIAVLRDGRFEGVVRRADLLVWLSLQSDTKTDDRAGPPH